MRKSSRSEFFQTAGGEEAACGGIGKSQQRAGGEETKRTAGIGFVDPLQFAGRVLPFADHHHRRLAPQRPGPRVGREAGIATEHGRTGNPLLRHVAGRDFGLHAVLAQREVALGTYPKRGEQVVDARHDTAVHEQPQDTDLRGGLLIAQRGRKHFPGRLFVRQKTAERGQRRLRVVIVGIAAG